MLALSRLMSIMIEMKGFLEPETTTGWFLENWDKWYCELQFETLDTYVNSWGVISLLSFVLGIWYLLQKLWQFR